MDRFIPRTQRVALPGLAALALFVLIGCTAETPVVTPVQPAPASAVESGEIATQGAAKATPVPATSKEGGQILPASLPADIRSEIERARAEIEAIEEQISSVEKSGMQIDPVILKGLRDGHAKAEAHLNEIIDRAAKTSGSGGK